MSGSSLTDSGKGDSGVGEPSGPLSGQPDRAPEAELARDMARRALPVVPVVALVAGIVWGIDGALSGLFAVALVLANLALAAALLTWGARISLGFMMGAALFGYILRLGLLLVAVLVVRNHSWVEPVPLGVTLIVTHLGLLVWETRYVSASLAYPVLKPRPAARETRKAA